MRVKGEGACGRVGGSAMEGEVVRVYHARRLVDSADCDMDPSSLL